MLVFGKLEFCLRLKGHVLDLSLVLHVFLVDFVDFEFGIIFNLSDSLRIVLLNLFDVVAKLLSGVLGSLHILPELFKLLRHTLVVSTNDTINLVFILAGLLFFLSVELLEVCGISQHLLGVGLPLELQLSLTFLSELSDFLLF